MQTPCHFIRRRLFGKKAGYSRRAYDPGEATAPEGLVLETVRDLIEYWQRQRCSRGRTFYMPGGTRYGTIDISHAEVFSTDDLLPSSGKTLGRPRVLAAAVRGEYLQAVARREKPQGPICEPKFHPMDNDTLIAPLAAGAYEYAQSEGLDIPIDHPVDQDNWPLRAYWQILLETTGFDCDLFWTTQLTEEMNGYDDEDTPTDFSVLDLPGYRQWAFEEQLPLLELFLMVWKWLTKVDGASLARIGLPDEAQVRWRTRVPVRAAGGEGHDRTAERLVTHETAQLAENALRSMIARKDWGRLSPPPGHVQNRDVLVLWQKAFEAVAAYEGPCFIEEWGDLEHYVGDGASFRGFITAARQIGELRRALDPLVGIHREGGPAAVWLPLVHRLTADTNTDTTRKGAMVNHVGRTDAGHAERPGDRRGAGEGAGEILPAIPPEVFAAICRGSRQGRALAEVFRDQERERINRRHNLVNA